MHSNEPGQSLECSSCHLCLLYPMIVIDLPNELVRGIFISCLDVNSALDSHGFISDSYDCPTWS
jgi:hypothetical protein